MQKKDIVVGRQYRLRPHGGGACWRIQVDEIAEPRYAGDRSVVVFHRVDLALGDTSVRRSSVDRVLEEIPT